MKVEVDVLGSSSSSLCLCGELPRLNKYGTLHGSFLVYLFAHIQTLHLIMQCIVTQVPRTVLKSVTNGTWRHCEIT